MTGNRNPVKQWEITYPQSGDEKKEDFVTKFPPYQYAIAAQETHEDGGNHIHLGLKLKKGLSHSKLVRWLEAKFPDDWKRIHISAIRSWDNFIDYCKKEDPAPYIDGTLGDDPETAMKKRYERLFANLDPSDDLLIRCLAKTMISNGLKDKNPDLSEYELKQLTDLKYEEKTTAWCTKFENLRTLLRDDPNIDFD